MLKNMPKLGALFIFFTINFAFATENNQTNNRAEKPESQSCIQEIERVSYFDKQIDNKVLDCMKKTNEFTSSYL